MQLDQSYENENTIAGNETCQVFMNDVIMEEMEKRFVDNPSVQTETNTNLENGEENMKKTLKTTCSKKVLETS